MGWIGTLLVTIGAWNIAYKHRSAIGFIIAGEVFWLAEAALIGKSDLILAKLVMIGIAARNFYYWGKDDVATTD